MRWQIQKWDLQEQIGALTNDLNQLSQLAAMFMNTSADFEINNEFVQNFTERVQDYRNDLTEIETLRTENGRQQTQIGGMQSEIDRLTQENDQQQAQIGRSGG